MAFHKVIGIDLGTTYSAVSVWDDSKNDGKGDVVVIPSPIGSNTLPSVVGLDPENKVIVGAPAQNNLVMDPGNTVIEVKREMGEYERLPDPIAGDPGVPRKIRFRDRDYLPQEISAFILMELKRMAENYMGGEPIHDAVITVPAYFKEPQKGATADAAAMARLNLKRLLNEPTAAAVCFGADKAPDGGNHIYAVYDLGGGTFDVSIIQVSEGNVSVVGTGGNSRLGGGDFDDRITGYVLQQIKEKHGVDLSQDPLIWSRIKREAEMRKRELSAAHSAVLNLPFLTPQLSVNIPITRVTFESIIDDLLKNSLECLDGAIQSAYDANGIQREEIEQVLLVGGSTRIPRIRTMLAEHLGMEEKDIRCDFNPDEVVSRGAAIVARDYNPSDGYEGEEIIIDTSNNKATLGAAGPGLVLQDVTSHSLGVNTNQSDFSVIIPKESRLPAEVTRNDYTNGGQYTELPVLIFQGEDPVSFNNTLIGKLMITELDPTKPAGFYRFGVTFTLNMDGLLNVVVKELSLNKEWTTKFECNVRTSKAVTDEKAIQLADEMAPSQPHDGNGASAATGSGLPQPPPAGSLPKPPTAGGLPRPPLPKPPQPAAPAQQTADIPVVAASILEPPAETPEQFKSITRRSFKLVSQMSPSPNRDKLLAAYTAFANAVLNHLPESEIQNLGDDLEDTYIDCK
jgi:molecular chaperone DnaK